MKYRDISHSRPAPDAKLPAFIVSVYENGDVLLYSHGGFDIWCVYQRLPGRLFEYPALRFAQWLSL